MLLRSRFNFTPLQRDPRRPLEDQLLPWLNGLFTRLMQAINGVPHFDYGTISTDRSINLHVADLVTLTLGANVTLTLTTRDVARGTRVRCEVAQDATGGRTLAFVNALTAPVIAAGAGDRTLLEGCYVGDGWVLIALESY